MKAAANDAISDALLHGSSGMQSIPRTEPGLVAAVILGGIPAIAAAWKPLLAKLGLRLKLTGVFCHGSPMVEFRGTRGGACELADLLIVVDIVNRPHRVRRAVLIQAKMACCIERVKMTGVSSLRQLQLYQRW